MLNYLFGERMVIGSPAFDERLSISFCQCDLFSGQLARFHCCDFRREDRGNEPRLFHQPIDQYFFGLGFSSGTTEPSAVVRGFDSYGWS